MELHEQKQLALTEGLIGDNPLVVTQGLNFAAARLRKRVRTGLNRYALFDATAVLDGSPMLRSRRGRGLFSTYDLAGEESANPAGRAVLGTRDDPFQFDPEFFNDRVELQWASVDGASAYAVRRASDGYEFVRLAHDGRPYYQWTSPPQADGTAAAFNVYAVKPANLALSAALALAVTVVTFPTDPEAVITYNGAGTLTATIT